MLVSIVVPCYKSNQTIRSVVEKAQAEFEKMADYTCEFVLVNDCSPDGGETLLELQHISEDYDNVIVIDLAKNSGQHNAILAGMHFTKGEAIISIDDDMQTHPSQIKKLLEEFEKGYDIVYGYYPQKKHSMFRNFGSYINHKSVCLLIGKPNDLKTSSFWIIRKFVRDNVIQYPGAGVYLQGLFLRTTRNIISIPVEHHKREVGTSNYNLKKLLKLWLNIIGFSTVPLRLAAVTGILFSGVGFLGGLVILIRKILKPSIILGWSSMMVCLWFFSGIILLCIGLVGEYLGRLFLGWNREPQFVIRNIYKKNSEGKEDE